MSGINTNVASLFAQNNLSKTGKQLSTAINRLSSGLRVNSAKDDAAGLAISERFRAQIVGQEVAKRNSNDAISALEVGEGALGSITDALQRMRELANQASTGTLTSGDRDQLNLEYQQLSSEISRIIKDTNYNGISLLSTGSKNVDVQIGDKATNNIVIKVGSIQSQFESALVAATGSAPIAATNTSTGTLTLAQITATTGGVVTGTAGPNAAGVTNEKFEYDINGDKIADVRFNKPTAGSDSINSYEILDSNGQTVRSGTLATPTPLASVNLGDLGFSDVTATSVNESGASSYTFRFGDVDVQLAVTGTTPLFTQATYNSAKSITGADGSAARTALTKISTFLDQVSQQRATFGAGINRLDSIINNLDTSITATSAARGRIIDADFARETANLTRAQILQQAGTSVLAQANQLPSSVLSLLG